MYRAVLAFFLLAVSALPAAAQVKMTWQTSSTDTGATLFFGVSETDGLALSFLCDKGNPTVLATSHIGSAGLKADDPAQILLTAGKLKKTLAGKAVANEDTDAVDVDAGVKLDDIKALLAGGKTLAVETKGAKQQIALTGAPAAYAAFEAACKAK